MLTQRIMKKLFDHYLLSIFQKSLIAFSVLILIPSIDATAQFRLLTSMPDDGIANVDPSEKIRLRFSDSPEMNTLEKGAIIVRGSRSGMINGDFTYLGAGEIVFTPDNEFIEGETITIIITSEVVSVRGETLNSALNISFRVRSAAQFQMSVDETLLGLRTAQSIVRSDQDPELTYEVLLGRAEDLAVKRLGIDVVKVSSYTIGLERATAIQTGWYLSPTTYFGIIHEVYETTPRTLFRLEYAVKDNMEILLTQGNDRRQGIDLLWGKNY